MDIAATVNPATVHFRSLTDPEKLGVIEQNYEYDLLEPAKLLHKYVGKEVTLVRSYQENNTTKREEIKATLLSDNNGPVWKIGNDIVTGMFAESYRFPEVPANLYDRPTLLMSLENSGARKQQIEASYLANNLSWNADYVLTVARDDKHADLDGWVTVVNNSGTAFHNARLQLVAGELNRIQTPAPMEVTKARDMAVRAAVQQFQQEAFSEYHLYSLGRPATLRDRETQGLTMLEPRDVKVKPIYVYRGGDPRGVTSALEVVNAKDSGLGAPLPGGRVRFYEADASGALQFTGETRIAHTAADEKMTLEVGTAFDLAAERKEAYNKIITDHEREYQVVIELRNRKLTDVVIRVEENVGGDNEVTQKTHEFTRKDANTLVFNVPVPKGQKVTLSYTVRVRY
jgi:hypothetical protein